MALDINFMSGGASFRSVVPKENREPSKWHIAFEQHRRGEQESDAEATTIKLEQRCKKANTDDMCGRKHQVTPPDIKFYVICSQAHVLSCVLRTFLGAHVAPRGQRQREGGTERERDNTTKHNKTLPSGMRPRSGAPSPTQHGRDDGLSPEQGTRCQPPRRPERHGRMLWLGF